MGGNCLHLRATQLQPPAAGRRAGGGGGGTEERSTIFKCDKHIAVIGRLRYNNYVIGAPAVALWGLQLGYLRSG